MHRKERVHRSRRRRRNSAFTLVELLVVISIIGVLLGLLFPAIGMVKEASRRTNCASNLHQIGIAMANFKTNFKTYPAGQKKTCPTCKTMAWSAFFLPFIEEQALYKKIDFKQDLQSAINREAVGTVIPLYICPSVSRLHASRGIDNRVIDLNRNGKWDPIGEGMACIDYGGISGPATSLVNPMTKKKYGENDGVLLSVTTGQVESKRVGDNDITDGLSKTVMIGECSGRGAKDTGEGTPDLDGVWAGGQNVMAIKLTINQKPKIAWDEEELFSDHPGGAHALFCDAAVRFLNEATALEVLTALVSRHGGETLPQEIFQ